MVWGRGREGGAYYFSTHGCEDGTSGAIGLPRPLPPPPPPWSSPPPRERGSRARRAEASGGLRLRFPPLLSGSFGGRFCEVWRSGGFWAGRQDGPKKNREKTEKLDKFYQQVLNFLFSLFEVGRHTWLLHYYLKSTVVILSFLPFSCIYKKYSSKRTVIPKTPSDEIYFLCWPRDGVSLLPGTMTSQDNNVVILRFLPI